MCSSDLVDLRVHQEDGADGGVTQGSRGLQCREASDLLQDVGRRVEQKPVLVIGADRDGGLRAWLETRVALAAGMAIGAVAVPLGKSPACSRA